MLFQDKQRLGIQRGITIIVILLASAVMAAEMPISTTDASAQLAPKIPNPAPTIALPTAAPSSSVASQKIEKLNSTSPMGGQTEQPQSHADDNSGTGNNAVQRIFRERQMAERKANQENMRRMELRKRWEARRAKLSTYYQKLRQKAADDGVKLSDIPPWDEAETNHSPTNTGSPFVPRSQEFAAPLAPNVQSNAEDDVSHQPFPARPQTFSNQPDLERMQAVIDGMTPEERDVCTTVHRLSMGLMQHLPPPAQPPMPEYYSPPSGYGRNPGRMPGIAPGQGTSYDYSNGPAEYGPHPGYNSPGYSPRSYDRGMKYQAPNWQSDW